VNPMRFKHMMLTPTVQWCMRDECLVVEREGSAGGTRNPQPRDAGGMLRRAMPHAPRLAKESS
jgi:hypothetical protein